MGRTSWAATASGKPSECERVIGELTRGREITNQLLSILRETQTRAGTASSVLLRTGAMVEKIIDSFTDSLSILSKTAGSESDEVVSQILNLTKSSAAVPKSEDSGENCKTPAPKDRRGCYKRRRTSETWTKETPTIYEDGHSWRKYGQKSILHANHPRNYYRCTHKYDQGCVATKKIQKVQDEPTMYRTTYDGHHTCKKLSESSLPVHHHQLIMEPTPQDSSSIIWSFQQDQVTTKSSLMSHNNNINCDDDFLICPNNYQQWATFDPLIITSFPSSPAGVSEVMSSDVYSCTTSDSPHSIDMENIMNFEDLPDF